ncbi:MAG: N-acetylmuramoyl-L-alanine amidase [Opitutales bacterium]|nr:N-acetylmuramoyl-L-alanine amidase [Opitutales bacterium]
MKVTAVLALLAALLWGGGVSAGVHFGRLDAFQGTAARDDLVERLFGVYVSRQMDRSLIDFSESALYVRQGAVEEPLYYRLAFAVDPVAGPEGETAEAGAEVVPELLSPSPHPENGKLHEGSGQAVRSETENPLAGWRIALDPGHLGGAWSRMEHRHFRIGDDPPVVEGDLVLKIAFMVRERLERLGAEVFLAREDDTPVTRLRPEDFLAEAEARLAVDAGEPPEREAVERLANRMFYVSAENRARAERIRERGADLVLCLHIDAVPWPDPDEPTLVERDHSHVIVNGAYSSAELAEAEQRVLMLERLLRGFDRVEIPLAESLAKALAEASGLPPFRYRGPNARRVSDNPYVWARNLAANRLFPAPTVFLEPYVANSKVTYARLQAGDYDGLRIIGGEERPSIFREYADAVAAGLERFARRAGPPPFDRLFPEAGLNPETRGR